MKTTSKEGKNVEARLKVHLLQGKTITHNQALRKFRTNRLAEFIRRLRKEGMKIETVMVNDDNGDVYGLYRLVKIKKVSRIKTRAYMEQVYSKTLARRATERDKRFVAACQGPARNI